METDYTIEQLFKASLRMMQITLERDLEHSWREIASWLCEIGSFKWPFYCPPRIVPGRPPEECEVRVLIAQWNKMAAQDLSDLAPLSRRVQLLKPLYPPKIKLEHGRIFKAYTHQNSAFRPRNN